MPEQQFGHGGKLYFGSTALTGRPPTGTHFNNNTWTEYKRVRDLTLAGGSVSVDTTTRDEAARGWATSIDVVSNAVLTFEVRWKPNDNFGTPNDAQLDQLLSAWVNRKMLALLHLDQSRTVQGAQGMVGNFSISVEQRAPVQGIFLLGVTATVAEFPDWIQAQDTSGTNFIAID